MLAHVAAEYRATPKLRLSARIGGGIDLLSLSYRLVDYHDLEDTSVAFEIGCSAWLAVGHGIEVGGSLDGLYADHAAAAGDARLPGPMYDSQLLIGARFNSRP